MQGSAKAPDLQAVRMEVLHIGCSGGAVPLLTPLVGDEKQLVGIQKFGG